MHIALPAHIIRGLIPSGCDREVFRRRAVVGLVEVIERREREQQARRDGVRPVGDEKRIALRLAIAQAIRLVVLAGLLPIVLVWVVRNLKIVLPILRVEAQLILGGLIANQ